MPDRIEKTVMLKAPVARVWRALPTPSTLRSIILTSHRRSSSFFWSRQRPERG
jgi:uncharacterized protein YndB with AHSA1/START domain